MNKLAKLIQAKNKLVKDKEKKYKKAKVLKAKDHLAIELEKGKPQHKGSNVGKVLLNDILLII